MKSRPRIPMVLCFIGFLLQTCNETFNYNAKVNQNPSFNNEGKIVFNGSFLEFINPADFDQVISRAHSKDLESFTKWLNDVGFKSQNNLFSLAVAEQNKFLNGLPTENGISQGDLPGLLRSNSSYLKSHERIFNVNNNAIIYGLSIFLPELANLVNEDGVLKVGGNLLQYNATNYKIIHDGDVNKLPLLDANEITNSKLGIEVIPVNTIRKGMNPAGRYVYDHYFNWDIHRFIAADLEVDTELHISTFQAPVYSSTCVMYCPPATTPGGIKNRAAATNPDCYCTYPIVGYQNYTNYTSRMVVYSRFLWTWQLYQPDYSQIAVNWSVDGQPQVPVSIVSGGWSTTSGTIYSGPQKNITYGRHTYTVGINYNPFGSDWSYYSGWDQFSD